MRVDLDILSPRPKSSDMCTHVSARTCDRQRGSFEASAVGIERDGVLDVAPPRRRDERAYLVPRTGSRDARKPMLLECFENFGTSR